MTEIWLNRAVPKELYADRDLPEKSRQPVFGPNHGSLTVLFPVPAQKKPWIRRLLRTLPVRTFSDTPEIFPLFLLHP